MAFYNFGHSTSNLFSSISFSKEEKPTGKVILAGNLIKLGHIIHSWKERYFELREDGSLTYLAKKGDIRTLGVIQIQGAELELLGKKNTFKIIPQKEKEYFITAKSEKQFKEWLEVLTKMAEKEKSESSNSEDSVSKKKKNSKQTLHVMQEWKFFSPVVCSFCLSLIYGLFNKGYNCVNCQGFPLHETCKAKAKLYGCRISRNNEDLADFCWVGENSQAWIKPFKTFLNRSTFKERFNLIIESAKKQKNELKPHYKEQFTNNNIINHQKYNANNNSDNKNKKISWDQSDYEEEFDPYSYSIDKLILHGNVISNQESLEPLDENFPSFPDFSMPLPVIQESESPDPSPNITLRQSSPSQISPQVEKLKKTRLSASDSFLTSSIHSLNLTQKASSLKIPLRENHNKLKDKNNEKDLYQIQAEQVIKMISPENPDPLFESTREDDIILGEPPDPFSIESSSRRFNLNDLSSSRNSRISRNLLKNREKSEVSISYGNFQKSAQSFDLTNEMKKSSSETNLNEFVQNPSDEQSPPLAEITKSNSETNLNEIIQKSPSKEDLNLTPDLNQLKKSYTKSDDPLNTNQLSENFSNVNLLHSEANSWNNKLNEKIENEKKEKKEKKFKLNEGQAFSIQELIEKQKEEEENEESAPVILNPVSINLKRTSSYQDQEYLGSGYTTESAVLNSTEVKENKNQNNQNEENFKLSQQEEKKSSNLQLPTGYTQESRILQTLPKEEKNNNNNNTEKEGSNSSLNTLSSTSLNTNNSSKITSTNISLFSLYPSVLPGVDPKILQRVQKICLSGSSDWNARFQSTLTAKREAKSMQEKIAVSLVFLNLHRDFCYTAKNYGRIIITEHPLPKTEKTLKPLNIGGIAGGEKFVAQNILFKFANNDTWGLFESDYASAKVANHELTGASAYCNLQSDICTPLSCIVDYRGYRLLASSILPISPKTIISGSSDAGRTVHSSDATFNSTLKNFAEKIGIQPHICGLYQEATKLLHSCIDTEGHLGSDGRYYVVDLSRTFPPEAMRDSKRNTHLSQLLRPEFLSKYKRPLVNDGFSKFINHDPKQQIYNQELEKATRYLQEVIVPETAGRLDVKVSESINEGSLLDLDVIEIIHSYGVNVRYLGLLYKHTKSESSRSLLLIEMVKRVVKIYINQQIRTLSKQLHAVLEEPTRLVVTDILNRVYGLPREQEPVLWRKVIVSGLLHTFSLKLLEIEAITLKKKVLHFKIHDPFTPNPRVDLDTAFQICQKAVREIHNPQLVGCQLFLTIQEDNFTKHFELAIPESLENSEFSKSTNNNTKVYLTLSERQFSNLMTGKITWKLLSEEVDVNQDSLKLMNLFFYELLPLVVQEPYLFCPDAIVGDGAYLLLKGLCDSLGIRLSIGDLTPQVFRKSGISKLIKDQNRTNWILGPLDIVSLDPRVKTMNIIDHSKGILLAHMSKMWSVNNHTDKLKSLEIAEESLKTFRQVIRTNPNNSDCLLEASKICIFICKLNLDSSLEKVGLSSSEKRSSLAGAFLFRALSLGTSNSNDSKFQTADILVQIGILLSLVPENELAEEFFLRALLVEPFHLEGLNSYARFLEKNGRNKDAGQIMNIINYLF